MKLPTIPEKLEEWKLEVLNELIKYQDIESETLDFKKEPNEIQNHICAMANTNGGFLILGINEIKSSDGKKIIGFEKKGFSNGEQDGLRNTIGNGIFNIEPTPTISLNHIPDGEKFYTIIEIKNETSKKPYFIKDKGQCYVRIENSTRPASRSTVIRLFSASLEQRSSIEKLRVASGLVKESLMFTSEGIQANATNYLSKTKISPVDLTLLRNAVLSGEWFLTENDLLGKHTSQNQYTGGINAVLYNIELMNTYIKAYNQLTSGTEKESVMQQLSQSWNPSNVNIQNNIEIFDKIIKTADEFLVKYP